MDIQYCCYGNDKLYGVAVFSSATNSILYYASTVNCPSQIESQKVEGAQFDLQVKNATSQDVNATGSWATFCGGIEYRGAEAGFFRYQTISLMTCMYAVAYTDTKTTQLDIYDSNILKITLKKNVHDPKDPLYSGLIHIRYTDFSKNNNLKIEHFCFIDNIFNDGTDDNSIISRGTLDEKVVAYPVTLVDCYYDCSNDRVAFTNAEIGSIDIKDCHSETATLNNIEQLDLGECKGKIAPAPLTPTAIFTDSKKFSKSFYLHIRIFFSVSAYFSNSLQFFDSHDPGKSEGGKNKTAMIAGIAAAAAAVVIAGIIAAVFIIKKKRTNFIEEDLETIKDTQNVVNDANPIYDKKAEEDPFQEDFDK